MSQSDLLLVQKKFDVDGNFRFDRDEIIAALSPVSLVPEEDNKKQK